MAIQKLSAFEKTSIQCRHSLKRLEVFVEISPDDEDVKVAEEIIKKLQEVRKLIPYEARDVDLKEKE